MNAYEIFFEQVKCHLASADSVVTRLGTWPGRVRIGRDLMAYFRDGDSYRHMECVPLAQMQSFRLGEEDYKTAAASITPLYSIEI